MEKYENKIKKKTRKKLKKLIKYKLDGNIKATQTKKKQTNQWKLKIKKVIWKVKLKLIIRLRLVVCNSG